MTSIFVDASGVLNEIVSGKTKMSGNEMKHSRTLQLLYIRYIRMMSSVRESLVLGPRAFFIYLLQRARPYTSVSLEEKVRSLVDDAQILDATPTEEPSGRHTTALNIFSSM